jgi:multidrug efflux system outer membrane protein
MIAAARPFLFVALLGIGVFAAETPRPAPTLGAPDLAWWRGFNDPQLDALLQETLAANPDLKIAAARLGVARAALNSARTERRPSLSLGAGAQRRAYSRTERAADPTLATAATALSLGPTAGYEVDLWGRLARGVDAGAAEFRASAEDAAALQLTLTGEVAATWFALRANTRESKLLAARLENARALLALLAARASAGLADATPAAEQRVQLAALDREAATLAEQRARLLHHLAALRGLRPEAAPPLVAPALAAAPANPLPAGLTTAVLARRPDLRAAAARLAAQQARVGEARAAAFPALALSAQGLFTGASLRELLRTGSLGSFIAAQITVPLLDGGRRAARTDSARAELTVAAETYAALTLRAFQETADALATVESAHAELRAADSALVASRQLLALAVARQTAGRTGGLEPLAAHDGVLLAETDLSRAHLAEHRALVALAQTLGGDWVAPAPALAALP